MTDRTIKVGALTRVEGEGGLHIRMRGPQVEEIRLEIFERQLIRHLRRGYFCSHARRRDGIWRSFCRGENSS